MTELVANISPDVQSTSMDRLPCRSGRFTWRMDGTTSRSGDKRANVLVGG